MTQIDDLPPLREVIRRHGLSPKKSLGQNFLLDLNLTARIARAGGALDGVTVVEIGPGPGGLTRALLAEGAARVIAVERDARAIAALEEIAARYPGRLAIVEADALAFDARDALAGARARVIANLPYNIATALLIGWLTAEPWPPWYDALVLMFQREVAERIVAAPGGKIYGRLSVLANWRCETKILFDVKPAAFVPPPKVTSSVVRLVPRAAAARLRCAGPAAGDGGRLRPAPQDAAAEPEDARRRCRRAAGRRRDRADGAGGGDPGRGICAAGHRLRQRRLGNQRLQIRQQAVDEMLQVEHLHALEPLGGEDGAQPREALVEIAVDQDVVVFRASARSPRAHSAGAAR